MEPIYVTKSFLPPIEEFIEKIRSAWDSHMLTNDGPLYQEFEQNLREYTNTSNLVCLGNGTLALQIAIRALDLKGEVLTTPFTHPATSGSLIWEGCKPVYVDIDPETLNIDVTKIEEKITSETTGIMATHVYSNPCDVEAIKAIADKHNLKVIYDGAHAFGVNYKGKSVLSYGDISMVSFNATKIMHSVEGGALFVQNSEMVDYIRKLAYFGLNKSKTAVDSIYGTNAKLIEFCAAMGTINLKYFPTGLKVRETMFKLYVERLKSNKDIRFQKINESINYSYMPIILSSKAYKEKLLLELNNEKIYPREYFNPSLEIAYSDEIRCANAFDISNRILCLPMSDYLKEADVNRICDVINRVINEK